ncbi:MAG: hypothetical protein ACRDZX_14840 [Acidimicrobiales bacterium]
MPLPGRNGDMLWYRRYGLDLLSEVPFGTEVSAPASGGADLVVRYRNADPTGMTADLQGDLTGETLAELWNEAGKPAYTLVRDAGGYCLRVHRVADFVMDTEVSQLYCEPVSGAPPGLAELLLQATVLAFVLTLRGRSVLHASAVSVAGRVLAIAGPAGSGKSTLAALLCAGGAALVADDLACIEHGSYVVGTGPGAELRLRPGSATVVEQFSAPPLTEKTADMRLAVRAPSAPDEAVPLAAVLFPVLYRGEGALRAERAQHARAVVQLVRAARISGWRDLSQQRRFFNTVLELAQKVPTFFVHVPWASVPAPLAPEVLLAALDAAEGDGTGGR